MLPDNFYCPPEYYDDFEEEDIDLLIKLAQIDYIYEGLFGEEGGQWRL